jgi:hypothetical protein
MSEIAPLTPEQFAERFKKQIRVVFDWGRHAMERWPVIPIKLTNLDELKSCFAPWYSGPDGRERSYRDADATPISIAAAPLVLRTLSGSATESRRNAVNKAADLCRRAGTAQEDVPAYRVGEQSIILDGNHRLAAIAAAGVPFVVTLWRIDGPLDPTCLWDLTYWANVARQQ